MELNDSNLTNRKEVISLLDFIRTSPTAYHAGSTAQRLCVEQNDFTELRENQTWKITPGGKYFVSRDFSSFIAFIMPQAKPTSTCILGAHTDSPGLKLKPFPAKTVDNASLICPEVYGGATIPSWIGRKLGLAGLITYLDAEGQSQESLINLGKTIGKIPYLAIHLDRTQKNAIEINFQDHLPALCGLNINAGSFNLEKELQQIVPFSKLLSHELFLIPTDPAEIVNNQLIFSPRLDNLLGAHACLYSLLTSQLPEESQIKMVVCWDHEEVGSDSYKGAASNFLESVLGRICNSSQLTLEELAMLKANSGLISVDAAHGRHPNYGSKHEPSHAPLLGMGPVIKRHANQSYATSSKTAPWIHLASLSSDVPIQNFVVRSDTLCGSTIGNIAAPRLGIAAVDIGAPILEMHAIEETGSLLDHVYMCRLLKTLLEMKL